MRHTGTKDGVRIRKLIEEVSQFYCKKRGPIDSEHCRLCHGLLKESGITDLSRPQCKSEQVIPDSELMSVEIVCSWCKQLIRVARWPKTERTGAVVSHGLCSKCKVDIISKKESQNIVQGNA